MLAKRIELRRGSTVVCYDGKSPQHWVNSNAEQIFLILLDLKLPDL
jgi:hypothetical protein